LPHGFYSFGGIGAGSPTLKRRYNLGSHLQLLSELAEHSPSVFLTTKAGPTVGKHKKHSLSRLRTYHIQLNRISYLWRERLDGSHAKEADSC
jgi:hypothetical protein